MERKIYIVLSNTGALTCKFLKLFTHDEYNHVSISLSPTLDKMYSFGRRTPYNPFNGGFVEEGKDIGTFKRFYKTIAKVLEIKVTEEQYNSIQYFINYFIERKKEFKYNYWGVFLALFKKDYKTSRKFYCSQFVKACLTSFGIENSEDLPEAVKPIDFLKLTNNRVVYTGLLRNYNLQ